MGSRDVNGFVLLDKPRGLTSNRALQKVKRLFDARKAGHTGSLDPLATGMLPLCFGAATRVAQYALAADKTYEVTTLLGIRTDTDDADGTVVEERPVPALRRHTVTEELARWVGPSEQTPPMYSALKHEGQRLYALARRGVEVERAPRPITIHALELVSLALPEVTLRVRCSKGTYVRTLVTDIARALGTVGHVTCLRRLSVAPFDGQRMWSIEDLEELAASGWAALDAVLLPIDFVLLHWPKILLGAGDAGRIRQGQRIRVAGTGTLGRHRLYASDGRFIGIGDLDAEGGLAPRRVLT